MRRKDLHVFPCGAYTLVSSPFCPPLSDWNGTNGTNGHMKLRSESQWSHKPTERLRRSSALGSQNAALPGVSGGRGFHSGQHSVCPLNGVQEVAGSNPVAPTTGLPRTYDECPGQSCIYGVSTVSGPDAPR